MNDDVDAIEALANRLSHCRATFGRSDIRRHKKVHIPKTAEWLAGSDENPRANLTQSRRDCLGLSPLTRQ